MALKKPTFIQLDPNELSKGVLEHNVATYDAADKDAYSRLGNLYPTRDIDVARTGASMAGVEDPMYQSAFAQSGIGPINLGKTASQRSLALRQPVMAGGQRLRDHWEQLWNKEGAERQGPMNGDAALKVAVSNSGNKNAFNDVIQSISQSGAQAEAQQQAALFGALAKGASPVVNAGVNQVTSGIGNTFDYYSPSNYLNPSTYNYTPPGGSYDPGFAPSSYGGAFEGTMDSMPVYRAEPASSGYNPFGSGP